MRLYFRQNSALKSDIVSTFLESCKEGLLIWETQDGDILLCNDTAGSLLGLSCEEILSRKFGSVVSFLQPEVSSQSETALAGTGKISFINRSNQHIALSLFSTPFVFDLKEVMVTFLRSTPITAPPTKDESHSDRLIYLGKMAGGLVHDLNTPLAALEMTIKNLREEIGTTNQSVGRYLDRIERISVKLMEMTDSLRRFIRNDESQPTPFTVGELFDDLNLLIKDRLEKNGVTLRVDSENNVNPLYLWHKIELVQVLLNLVNNAIDAASASLNGQIEVKCTLDGGCFEIQVIDSGPGIPFETRQHLFRRPITTKPPDAGTGIGLLQVKRIVESYGGTITLADQIQPTTFIVRLPDAGRRHE